MTTEEMLKNDVCVLLNAVIEMRTHQKNYFKYKHSTDKVKAMHAEKIVDEVVNRLKVRGYIRPPGPTQSKMDF